MNAPILFSPFPRRPPARGVTIIEVLVVAVLLAILAALLFPVAGQFGARNRDLRCLHHIRHIGAALTAAITEKGGVFDAWYSGKTGGDYWNTMLVRDGYLTDEGLEKLSCPNIAYADASGGHSGRHYGISMPDTANLTDYKSESGALLGRSYRVDLRRVGTPAGTIFLADSVTGGGDPTIRIFRSDSGSFASGAFQGRHHGRVNLFFYDGHAESADGPRLYALGVRKIYDANLQPLVLTSKP